MFFNNAIFDGILTALQTKYNRSVGSTPTWSARQKNFTMIASQGGDIPANAGEAAAADMTGMASYLSFGALWNLFMTVVIGYCCDDDATLSRKSWKSRLSRIKEQ